MVTAFDIDAGQLIVKLKEELKKVDALKQPVWANYAKSAANREKPPEQEDFWHIRAASLMRQLYKLGVPTGIQRLRTKYGGRNLSRAKPKHFKKGSGKILRVILQQLETAGLVKKVNTTTGKGRILSPAGKSMMDKLAAKIQKEKK